MSTPTTTDATAAVSGRRLNLISVTLVLGAITTLLDTTIVNIALDHLHLVFHASVAQTQWVATAYLLAFVSVIPLSGWAADRFGSRNAWMFAVAAFLVGSALCGLSWSLPALIGFRVLQGIGGGMVLPITISILTRAAGPDRVAQAMIAVALPAQLAPILGPVIGGSILQGLDWHWLFFVNIPLCAAALVLAPRVLPSGDRLHGERLDIVGFALLTPAVVALAYGVSQAAGPDGFAAGPAWLPIAIGAGLVIAFTLYSLRAKRTTLIDVRVFGRRSFGVSSIITFVSGFSLFALMFLLPLFYQQLRGQTPLHTGLLLIPQGLGTTVFLFASRPFLDKLDGRLVIAGGVVLTMAGLVPFALAGSHGDQTLLLVAQFVQGIGMGATTVPVMALALAGLGPAETPRGSAAFSIVQRVGAPFGVSVVAIILQSFLDHTAASPVGSFQATFWWVFAFCGIPLLLAFFVPAKRAGERLTA